VRFEKDLENSKFFNIHNNDILWKIEEIVNKDKLYNEENSYFMDCCEYHNMKLLYKDIHYICLPDKILIEFNTSGNYTFKKNEEFLIVYLLTHLVFDICDDYELYLHIAAIKVNGLWLQNFQSFDDYDKHDDPAPYDNFIEIYYSEHDNLLKERYLKTKPDNTLAFHLRAYSFGGCKDYYEK